MSETDRPSSHDPIQWTVRVDKDLCGLCGVCAENCPSGALRTEATEGVLQLIFEPHLCTSCPEQPKCQENGQDPVRRE